MIMLCRSKIFRTSLPGGILFTTIVIGLSQEAQAVLPTPNPPSNSGASVPPLIISGRQSIRPAGTYSTGITEIIKLLEAKVDAPVILGYIQNSPIAYNPDATELIALKDHGASTEMMVALLHHGDQLRLQMAQAERALNAPPAAPAYEYAPEAAYPAYPFGYPDSSYTPYPATDYSYGYGWPLVYWPSVRIGGYWPYGYAHRRFPGHYGDGHHPGEGGHRGWASAAPVALQAHLSVSAPSSGHASSAAVKSGGLRSSGGRSGGRGH
jgi:hypothetical protein